MKKTPLFPELDITLQEDSENTENYEPYTGIVLDPEDNLFKTVSGVFKDKKDFYRKLTARGYVVRKVFEKVVFDWIEENAQSNLDAYMLYSTAFSKWRGNNMLDEYYVKLLNDVPKLNRERQKGNPNTRDAGKQESVELTESELLVVGCDENGNRVTPDLLIKDVNLPNTTKPKKVLDNRYVYTNIAKAVSEYHDGELKNAVKIKILKDGKPFRVKYKADNQTEEGISTEYEEWCPIKYWSVKGLQNSIYNKVLNPLYQWEDEKNISLQGHNDKKISEWQKTKDILETLVKFEPDAAKIDIYNQQIEDLNRRIAIATKQKSTTMHTGADYRSYVLQKYNQGKIDFTNPMHKQEYESCLNWLNIINKGRTVANANDYDTLMNIFKNSSVETQGGKRILLTTQSEVQSYLKDKKEELIKQLAIDNGILQESIPVVSDASLFTGSFVNDGATHAYHEIPTNGMITNPGAIKTTGTFCEGWIHEELNQDLFDGTHLRPEVRAALLQIAIKFEKTLDLQVKPVDIYLTGSSANFNYNESSDIDVHLVYDFEQVGITAKLLVDYFIAKKQVFNSNYNIKVKGLPVEVGVENLNTPIVSTAIYSLVKDGWLIEPEYAERILPVPDMQQYYKIVQNIENAIQSRDSVEIGKLWDELYALRTASLQNEGELSKGNALFKKLRNLGYLERLKKAYYSSASEELSLEALKEI